MSAGSIINWSSQVKQFVAALGVKVIQQLGPAERQTFVRATHQVYDKWHNQIGANLVNKTEKAIEARKK